MGFWAALELIWTLPGTWMCSFRLGFGAVSGEPQLQILYFCGESWVGSFSHYLLLPMINCLFGRVGVAPVADLLALKFRFGEANLSGA